MEELAQTLGRQQAGTAALLTMHEEHTRQMQELEKQLTAIPAVGQQLLGALGNWHNTMGQHYQAHNQQLTQLHGNLSALPQTGDKISNELREFRTTFAQQSQQQLTTLTTQTQTGAQLAAQVQQLANALQNIAPTAASVTPMPKPAASGGMFSMLKKQG
jgi:methyl-accepting chemotaxis protein